MVQSKIDNLNNDEAKEELAADGTPSGVEREISSPYPFDAEKISITTKKIALSNIVRRLDRKLIHAADIQRRESLWDRGRQSRLIESLMLKIPLPLFYASADKNDELVIVDGLQRISSIRNYMILKNFGLEELEFLRELSGKKYDELPDRMKIRIEETELDFVIINPESPPEVQRNIFKRLNTGGLPLTEQEIRHALYYGHSTDLLRELVETDEFKLATDNSVKDSRMAAQELVLRFFAFSLNRIEDYRKDDEMDAFLSNTMQMINNEEKKIDEIREKFFVAMKRATALFDRFAFRISTPSSGRATRTPINKSLYDVWSVTLSNISEDDFNKLMETREKLWSRLDEEFTQKGSPSRRYIAEDSVKVVGVRGRYEIIRSIIRDTIQEGEK
jgi:hypothetical protein